MRLHLLLIVWIVGWPLAAPAQVSQPGVPEAPAAWSWRAVVEGTPTPLPDLSAGPDSLSAVAARLLSDLRAEGYLFAHLDSARVDSARHGRAAPTIDLFLQRGPEVEVAHVRIAGASGLDSTALAQSLDTRPGRPFRKAALDADIQALLDRYDRAGYGLARIHEPEIRLLPAEGPDEAPRLAVTLRVEEGRPLVLEDIELPERARTSPAYAARLLELRLGQPLASFDAEAAVRMLEEAGHYRRVGPPALRVLTDSTAVLVLDVEEEPPGAFDLVVGYLPSTAGGGGGSVVGNGHLLLRNLFGQGRIVSARLDRLPGQVSTVEARVADPYLFGTPFGAEVAFEGVQQDSTYSKQHYAAEVSYGLPGGLHVFATFSREATRPGQAGNRAVAGRPRIPRADALFTGLGVRYRRVDRRVNPRRGFVLETNYERGRKEQALVRDTLAERTALRQERLTATARAYLPTFVRQLVAVGLDARFLTSPAYDESDLFRFGGATTLRGYNESRFRGHLVARALAEYRFQLDRTSYAFAFFDLGYVRAPDLPEATGQPDYSIDDGVHTGYGIGLQFSTNLGLVGVSYAIGQEQSPTKGRVHVGLSFGL